MNPIKKNLIISCLVILIQIITISKSAAQLTEKDKSPILELIGEGVISSEKSEYKSVIYNHGKNMIFTRSENNYKGQVLMISKMINGKWSKPIPISFTDILYNDSDPFITPLGDKVYFVSNRPQSGIFPEKNLDIWKSSYLNGVWTKPVPLSKEINSEYNEFGPCLYKNKLYFNTYRDSGSGYLDLYYSEKTNGKFTKPSNLGKAINSEMNEFDPFVSSDGKYLVFSSWRKNGSFGKSDIYLCIWQNDSWSKPVNAGSLINSEFEENSPVFTDDSEYLYISSNRFDRSKPIDESSALNGSFNIYRIPIKEIFNTLKFE